MCLHIRTISLLIHCLGLKIGDMIPTELYEVVAEILVFVNDLDNLKAKIDQR